MLDLLVDQEIIVRTSGALQFHLTLSKSNIVDFLIRLILNFYFSILKTDKPKYNMAVSFLDLI